MKILQPVYLCNPTAGSLTKAFKKKLTNLLSNVKRPKDTVQYPEGTLYSLICIRGQCVIHK